MALWGARWVGFGDVGFCVERLGSGSEITGLEFRA